MKKMKMMMMVVVVVVVVVMKRRRSRKWKALAHGVRDWRFHLLWWNRIFLLKFLAKHTI